MDTYQLAAGSALTLQSTLADANGLPLAWDLPGPAITAIVWPGGKRPASFAPSVTWIDPTQGLFQIAISPDQTALLASGRYFGRVFLADPTLGQIVPYEWAIDLASASGTEVEPPSYCTFDDLRTYGRSWLDSLQTNADEAGFAQQRGRARQWLDDMILAACPRSLGPYLATGIPGYNPLFNWYGPNTPNPWLRAQLDAGALIQRGWVIEATAKRALSYICEDQVGPGTDPNSYAQLGWRLADQAETLALSRPAEIGDGHGNVLYSINLAARSLR